MSLFDKLRSAQDKIEQEDAKAHNTGKLTGRIIKLSDRGYGFISSKDIPFTKIFFHWSQLTQDTLNFQELRIGMIVEFEPLELENKGHRALRIRVLENNNVSRSE